MEGGPPSSCLQRGAPCHGIIGIMVNPPLAPTLHIVRDVVPESAELFNPCKPEEIKLVSVRTKVSLTI